MTEVVQELEVAFHSVGGVPVAAVRGEVDLDSSDRLDQALEDLRAADGPAIVDLDGVPFMDSSGLHVIVGLWRALRLEGRWLAVACPPGGVRKLFALTALDALVPLYDDVFAAARALRDGDRGLSEPAP